MRQTTTLLALAMVLLALALAVGVIGDNRKFQCGIHLLKGLADYGDDDFLSFEQDMRMVSAVVEDTAATPGAAERTPRQLLGEIARRLSINSIYAIKNQSLSIEERHGSRYIIFEYDWPIAADVANFGNAELMEFVYKFRIREELAP